MFEKSFRFLGQLKINNTREWYHMNKSLYHEARNEFEHITELLIREVSAFDKSVTGLRPQDCIFRIFRDIRFSTDKSPYKTNFGAFLSPGGKKSSMAGYYLHIEPGESMIATGIYMPPSQVLNAIRKEIYANPEEFREIVESEDVTSIFGGLSDDKLKSAPRGFPKDFKEMELLKYKNYGLITSRSDKQMKSENIIEDILTCFRTSSSFVRFLNEGIRNNVTQLSE